VACSVKGNNDGVQSNGGIIQDMCDRHPTILMSFESSSRLSHDMAGQANAASNMLPAGLIAGNNPVLACKHLFDMTTTRAVCHCHW
jgi:hypothetical protein